MRPTPARILLSALAIGAVAAGVVTSQMIFYVAGLMAGFLLVTSLSTSRNPLAEALLRFRHRAVVVRLWGATPSLPPPSGTTVLLTSVNVLGAGIHVFFQVGGGDSIHLKVAQPRNVQLGPNTVVVGSAKYVQWSGKKLPVVAGAPAVFIALSDGPVRPGHGVSRVADHIEAFDLQEDGRAPSLSLLVGRAHAQKSRVSFSWVAGVTATRREFRVVLRWQF